MDECKPLRGGAGLLAAAGRRRGHGKAVQVNLMKPTLKPPGTKRLKPKYDEPLSNFAFKFNLRRYITERTTTPYMTKYERARILGRGGGINIGVTVCP